MFIIFFFDSAWKILAQSQALYTKLLQAAKDWQKKSSCLTQEFAGCCQCWFDIKSMSDFKSLEFVLIEYSSFPENCFQVPYMIMVARSP